MLFLQIVYFIFLMVFSYVILVHSPSVPSITEVVLIVFVFTLCTEEVRQVTLVEIYPGCQRFSKRRAVKRR